MDPTLKEILSNMAAKFEKMKVEHSEALADMKRQLEAKKGREKFAFGGSDEPKATGTETKERKAFENFMRGGAERLSDDERKAMILNNDPSGGYTVEESFASEIQKVGAEQGVIRSLAKNYKAKSGDFSIIVNPDLAGAAWITEQGSRDATTTPDFARVRPSPGGLYAVAPIGNWLLNDSAYPLAEFIVDSIGTQFGVSESAAFVSGNGVNKPMGFLSMPRVTTADATRPFGTIQKVDTGGATTLTIDNVIDLLGALAPRYRKNAAFVMHPDIASFLRKLKASTSGDYYWQPSLVAGAPDTLLGVPVGLDVNMPNTVASTNAVIAVADWTKAYAVVDVGPQMMLRDPLTSKGNTLFYAERRVGGNVVDSNAIKILVCE